MSMSESVTFSVVAGEKSSHFLNIILLLKNYSVLITTNWWSNLSYKFTKSSEVFLEYLAGVGASSNYLQILQIGRWQPGVKLGRSNSQVLPNFEELYVELSESNPIKSNRPRRRENLCQKWVPVMSRLQQTIPRPDNRFTTYRNGIACKSV